MRKALIIITVSILVFFTNNVQAKTIKITASKSTIKKSSYKKATDVKRNLPLRVKNWDFVPISTQCPDGSIMYAGIVGIQSDDSGTITDVRVDYWGESVACADHQVLLWA